MRNAITVFAVAALCAAIAACTSITVTPVEPALKMTHVCIKTNPDVRVSDFLPTLVKGLTRNGVTSEVLENEERTKSCEFVLTYTALQTWDFTTYLSKAEIWIHQDGKQVAYAEYHLRGKGGLSPAKWADTESKMDPVIDELFGKN